MELTPNNIMKALGIETKSALAEFFSTSRQNVHQWADDQPIPEGRQWQAIALRPDLFAEAAETLKKSN